jgi:hypothetical protein
MKFSQVEFSAVLASVLRRVRVGLVEDGRGEVEKEKERERVMRVLRDSVAEPLLLHVREPEKLCIRVTER